MGMMPPPPSTLHPSYYSMQGPAFPACHVQLQTSPTHIPWHIWGAAIEGFPVGPAPPCPQRCRMGPPPLPHAPLPRGPVLRSRGKSSFKNISSKAPSVSGGGCRGRGGREGDAAALDTEVTGRGGGRGQRACTWAHACVCVCTEHLAVGKHCLSPRPASVSLPRAAWMASCQAGSLICTAWPHPSSDHLRPLQGALHGCWATPATVGGTFHTATLQTPTAGPGTIHQSVGKGPSWVLLPRGS